MIRFRIPQSVWLQRLACLYTAASWPLDRVVVRTCWASAPGPQPYIHSTSQDTHLSRFLVSDPEHPLGTRSSSWAI